MRRYNIVSGILLIFPIIDFALAAPVVQEDCHACADVVHIVPNDMMTVLGKRVDPLDLWWDKYFEKLWGKPEESSATHLSSSSAPSEPSHGSTDVVQAPPPSPASSTASPDHVLVEPTSPSPVVSPMHEVEGGTEHAGSDNHLHGPLFTPAPSEVGLDHGLTKAHTPQPNPNPNPGPSTSADPEFDWKYWMNLEDPPRDHGLTKAHTPQPNPPSTSADPDFDWRYWMNLQDPPRPKAASSNSKLSTKSGVKWTYWLNPLNVMDPLKPGAVLSKPSKPKPLTKPGFNFWVNPKDLQWTRPPSSKPSDPKPSKRPSILSWNDLWAMSKNTKPSDPGSHPGLSSTKLDSQSKSMAAPKIGGPKIGGPKIGGPKIGSPESPEEPEDKVVPAPPPSPDPEVLLNPQTSSAGLSRVGFRPQDLKAAIYAAKGKGKGPESRRVSGTARDLENAAVHPE